MSTLPARLQALCLLKGEFMLRSGRIATEYFDKYRFEASPALLLEIAQRMQPLIPPETEVLAGLEMGGIAIATVLSQVSGLPTAFVRKSAKQYGTARLCEGAEVAGKQVLIVEDVVTSGGQVVLSAADLRALGARVDHAVCVIDREEGGADALSAAGLQFLPLLRRRDFQW
jgi:orotate phosphoribosyltransferase